MMRAFVLTGMAFVMSVLAQPAFAQSAVMSVLQPYIDGKVVP